MVSENTVLGASAPKRCRELKYKPRSKKGNLKARGVSSVFVRKRVEGSYIHTMTVGIELKVMQGLEYMQTQGSDRCWFGIGHHKLLVVYYRDTESGQLGIESSSLILNI